MTAIPAAAVTNLRRTEQVNDGRKAVADDEQIP